MADIPDSALPAVTSILTTDLLAVTTDPGGTPTTNRITVANFKTSILADYLPLVGGTMTGNLLFTDNSFDIGASGATRPRTGFFGTSVVSPLFNATTGFQIGGAATSRKMLVGNGTNFIASTETWAVPGTSGNVLTSDGTNWTSAPPAGGSITVGTTPIASGTGGRLVYETSGNKFGEIANATSDGTTLTTTSQVINGATNGAIFTSTGYSLTGSDATNGIDIAGAWNTSGTPTFIRVNLTYTAANAASKLIDLQLGGATRFKVDIFGAGTFGGGLTLNSAGNGGAITGVGQLTANSIVQDNNKFAIGNGGQFFSSDAFIQFSSTTNWTGSVDLGLSRISAGLIGVGTGAAGSFAGSLKAATYTGIVADAGTTTVTNSFITGHNSSGTPAAGLGSAILFNIASSTTADQAAAQFKSAWGVATHASRVAWAGIATNLVGSTTLLDRFITGGHTVVATDNTALSLFEVALATLQGCAGRINYSVFCGDGTEVQVRRGIAIYSAVNKGGSYTSEVAIVSEAASVSAGTLTATFAVVSGTNKITIQITPDTSLTTPTTYYVKWELANLSESAITVL